MSLKTQQLPKPKKFVTDMNGKHIVPGDFVITKMADGFPNWDGSIAHIQKVETIHPTGSRGLPSRMLRGVQKGLVNTDRFIQDGVLLNVQAKFIDSGEENSRITGSGYFPSLDCVKVKLTANHKLAWSQDYE